MCDHLPTNRDFLLYILNAHMSDPARPPAQENHVYVLTYGARAGSTHRECDEDIGQYEVQYSTP